MTTRIRLPSPFPSTTRLPVRLGCSVASFGLNGRNRRPDRQYDGDVTDTIDVACTPHLIVASGDAVWFGSEACKEFDEKARRLYPRSIVTGDFTRADIEPFEILADLTRQAEAYRVQLGPAQLRRPGRTSSMCVPSGRQRFVRDLFADERIDLSIGSSRELDTSRIQMRPDHSTLSASHGVVHHLLGGSSEPDDAPVTSRSRSAWRRPSAPATSAG